MPDSVIIVVVVATSVVLSVPLLMLERRRQYHCPRCGNTMYKTGARGGFMRRNQEMRCAHCGLIRWYKPPWPVGG